MNISGMPGPQCCSQQSESQNFSGCLEKLLWNYRTSLNLDLVIPLEQEIFSTVMEWTPP